MKATPKGEARRGPIRRVGVIGSGVMGSGIAAHFANAGAEVVLLDIVPFDLSEEDKQIPSKRNAFAEGAIKKDLKTKQPYGGFYHRHNASLVETGNLDDHLDLLKGCDLIVEAIIDKTGNVTNVKVLKGLPMGLDQAAADAVKKWKFEPATLNGKPVSVIYNLTVNFQLQ